MLRRPVLCFLALLALALCGISPASAHTNLSIKMLCGDMTRPPLVVHSFQLSGKQLRNLVDTTAKALEQGGLSADDKCGIVDAQLDHELKLESDLLDAATFLSADEWTQTTIALALYCGQFPADGVKAAACAHRQLPSGMQHGRLQPDRHSHAPSACDSPPDLIPIQWSGTGPVGRDG